ncbi:hypothetical protein LZ30DRAFT_769050 [Colletotrichum cereale]|nr:hypothetical protein LZ30DRAFT_769050 [Colletotrichum cereale]
MIVNVLFVRWTRATQCAPYATVFSTGGLASSTAKAHPTGDRVGLHGRSSEVRLVEEVVEDFCHGFGARAPVGGEYIMKKRYQIVSDGEQNTPLPPLSLDDTTKNRLADGACRERDEDVTVAPPADSTISTLVYGYTYGNPPTLRCECEPLPCALKNLERVAVAVQVAGVTVDGAPPQRYPVRAVGPAFRAFLV